MTLIDNAQKAWAKALINTWDEHTPKHACRLARIGLRCPSAYPNLGAFMRSRDFPVDMYPNGILGRDLSETIFRSENSGKEIPVEETPVSKAAYDAVIKVNDTLEANLADAEACVADWKQKAHDALDARDALRCELAQLRREHDTLNRKHKELLSTARISYTNRTPVEQGPGITTMQNKRIRQLEDDAVFFRSEINSLRRKVEELSKPKPVKFKKPVIDINVLSEDLEKALDAAVKNLTKDINRAGRKDT